MFPTVQRAVGFSAVAVVVVVVGMVTLLAGANNSYGACVGMIGAMIILIVSW